MIVFLGLHFFKENDFLCFFVIAYKGSVFYATYFKLFWLVGPTHAQTTTFPFFEKENPSVGKIENRLSQYNCCRSAICHNLVLLTFLLFGPIYRRNKSVRFEVRDSVGLKLSCKLLGYNVVEAHKIKSHTKFGDPRPRGYRYRKISKVFSI